MNTYLYNAPVMSQSNNNSNIISNNEPLISIDIIVAIHINAYYNNRLAANVISQLLMA